MLESLFRQILKFRLPVLIMGTLFMGFAGSFLPSITRDTTSDAFIPKDNPARVYREEVKETFGLADPIVVAVFQDGDNGVFTPEGLQLVEQLTLALQDIPNIDPERVVSLSTENNIEGTDYGMNVESFYEPYPKDAVTAQLVWQKVSDFPLYLGSLVARDKGATLIVAEVFDEVKAEETYLAIESLVNNTALPPGVSIHIAGEASITGFMGMYIDSDARRLNPIAGLIITIILFLAFRTLAGALIPNLIVAATVVGAIGMMAAAGVSFFVITNSMPVVLIGIAVADSIHIFSAYYESIAKNPKIQGQDAVLGAMLEMARPITLTSLTTIAGFLGLYISSVQPPMQYMGLFTALGVAIAWAFSMTFLPAAMSYLKVKPSKALQVNRSNDLALLLVNRIGAIVVHNPQRVAGLCLLLVAAGIVGALNIEVDDRRIEVFNEKEPVYQADLMINRHFDGTSVFDIVVETDKPEALFNPAYLRKMEALQQKIETFEPVGGTTSVVDYLKQMNRSLNEGKPEEYRLVDDAELNAQLFFLYSTSGDPTDFEEEIDYDYQRANIRVNMKGPSHQEVAPVVEGIQKYILEEFNEPGLKATLSGRSMVTYEWVRSVGKSHFNSVAISMLLVLIMASLVFRSLAAGLLSLTPVAISILCVYAIMAIFDIAIGIGTSMFASVAIGLGVDFAIHSIDRIKDIYRGDDKSDDVMLALFPSTGRALLFNLLAIAFGFGILMTSDVVPLMRFGAIVALSVCTAFIFSLTLLPALILIIKPRFVYGDTTGTPHLISHGSGILLVLVSTMLLIAPEPVFADEALTGRQVMEQVVARDEGQSASRNLTMELTDRRGKTRIRETKGFRKYFGDEKRTVLFFLEPANIKDTGFLTYDYKAAAEDDDQWLYLPAVRKIRRISASDRGDYFLGTDFSFEDIKNESKPNLNDYHHKRLGTERVDGVECIVVEGLPVSDAVAVELGYGRVVSRIDPNIWMARKTEFWDPKGNKLKEIRVHRIEQIDGIWTSLEVHVENMKTGHKTRFTFSNVDYQTPVEDRWFETSQLRRGL